jgi:hypothetical protein
MNDENMGILHVVSDEEWHIEDGETPALLLASQLFMSPMSGREPMPVGMYPIWVEDDGNLGIGGPMRVQAFTITTNRVTGQVTVTPERPEDAISEATRWLRYFLFAAVLTAAVTLTWLVLA